MTSSRRVAMTILGVLSAVAIIIIVVRGLPARTPEPAPSTTVHAESSPGEVDDSTPQLDPGALMELVRMGSYLRTLKAFQLKADVVTEDVRTDGQKVQIIRNVDLVAKRPNRLFAEIKNNRQRRLFFYDGAHFTLFAPRTSFYATVEAPATIEKLADDLEDKYALELPLVDLFRWGTPEGDVRSITSAIDLGPGVINGATCEQYAFRQEGIDWQLWIQRGEQPLPCRVVITTLTDEARPQHSATYTWNLAPSYDDATFVFRPPGDAKQIPLAEVRTVATTAKTEPK